MSERTLTVTLPEDILRRLERAAETTYRSVEEVLVGAITIALPSPEGVPPELAGELGAMQLMGDEALLAAVEPSLAPAERVRLEQLNHAAGERTLSLAEEAEQEALLAAYHRSVLRRA